MNDAAPEGPHERTVGRRVVCAANRHADGTIVCGARHFDNVMRAQMGTADWIGSAQGFIDQRGVWMNRREAWKVAEAAGQILRRCGGDTANGGTLYSENLY